MGNLKVVYEEDHSKLYQELKQEFSRLEAEQPSIEEIDAFLGSIEKAIPNITYTEEFYSLRSMYDTMRAEHKELSGMRFKHSNLALSLGHLRSMSEFLYSHEIDDRNKVGSILTGLTEKLKSGH